LMTDVNSHTRGNTKKNKKNQHALLSTNDGSI
jgi:hypothetical protein